MRIPPLVVHGFRNGSDAEVRYLNFHAPGEGFADYMRGLSDFDQDEPPEDGGRPASEASVTSGGGQLCDGEEIAVAERTGDGEEHVLGEHVTSLYVLEGELGRREPGSRSRPACAYRVSGPLPRGAHAGVKSTKGYWIGGGLIVLGAVLAALWFVISFVRLDDQIDGFERVPVPGEQTVRLEARKYIVYYEGFPTPEELTIADAESGDDLEIEPYDGSLDVLVRRAGRVGPGHGDAAARRRLRGDHGQRRTPGATPPWRWAKASRTPLLRTIVGASRSARCWSSPA